MRIILYSIKLIFIAMDLSYILPFAAFIGLAAGIIVGKLSKEEFFANKKYLLLISRIILSALIIYLAYSSGNLLAFLVGIAIGFFFRAAYLYLGMASASALMSPQSLVVSSLIFLYGLPYGTLAFHKVSLKPVLSHLLIFLLPFTIIIIWPNYSSFLMPFSAGLLVGCLERKF